MKIVEISEKEYNSFIKNYKDSLFFQSIEWANYKEDSGWEKIIIGLKDDNKVLAAAILLGKKLPLLKKKMYYSPRGVIIDYTNYELIDNFTKQLKPFLKQHNALFLKINPYISYCQRDIDGKIISNENKDELIKVLKKNGYKHYKMYIKAEDKKELEPRWLSVLDIENKTIDEVFKNMHQTTRWMINKSQKNYINIHEATSDDIPLFKKMMQNTADRRKFEDRPLSYYQKMFEILGKSNMIKILIADIDLNSLHNSIIEEINHLNDRIEKVKDNPKKVNQVNEFKSQIASLENKLPDIKEKIEKYGDKPYIAAGLYLFYGDQVVYLYGCSYKEFMSYGAQYLMQYIVIKEAIDKKYKKFNFYGIDGDFRKESPNYGLFDFKRGFNANVVELIGEFDYPTSKFKYFIYTIMFNTYKFLKRIKRH